MSCFKVAIKGIMWNKWALYIYKYNLFFKGNSFNSHPFFDKWIVKIRRSLCCICLFMAQRHANIIREPLLSFHLFFIASCLIDLPGGNTLLLLSMAVSIL